MKKNILDKRNPTKAPGGAPNSIVVQKIDVRPFPRRDFEIPDFKTALQSAESLIPRRHYLYDLYADVELDDQVEADTAKLIDSITGANWRFVDKDGKEIEVVNQIIDTIGFERMLREIVKSKYWGYSMLEPTFYKNMDGEWEMTCYLIPRQNMRPETGIVAYDSVTDEGINIREGVYAKTILEVGDVDDLGTYLKAAPYRILKRGGFGDYAMFVQTFGEPIIDAVYDGLDETSRAALQTALNSRGPGGAIVRPQGTNINLLATSGTASGSLQDTFIANCNKGISKALLGTTETSDSSKSSGYAQSKTHESQNERKQESLIDFTRRVLNSRFKPILAAAGFEVTGGKFIIEGEDNELSKKDSFEIHVKMALPKDKGGLDIPISDDFFYDNYGVTKPDNYDALKAAKHEEAEKSQKPKAKSQKPEDDEEDPEMENQSGYKKLIRLFRDFFAQAPAQIGATGKVHTSNSPFEEGKGDVTLSDLPSSEGLGVGLTRRIWDAKGTLSVDYALFEDTFKTLLKAFKSGANIPSSEGQGVGNVVALSDSGDPIPPNLLTAYELNLFRFSAARSLAEVQELNELFRQSKSFAEFEKLAAPVLEKYNRTWLQTEYTTAQLVGEAAATYQRLLAKVDIFPYWMYRTVRDKHVRKEHAALEGLILPWDDPRWDQLFPPNGWNCRCFVVPRMETELPLGYSLEASRQKADSYFTTYEWRMASGSGWGVNRGKIGEIFTENQQYIYKQPGMAAKKLNALQASDYKLPSYSQMKKAANGSMPEGDAGEPVGVDYGQRPLTLPPAGRGGPNYLLAAMRETIAAPDEVWLQGAIGSSTTDELVYVRYYRDRAVVVSAQVTPGGEPGGLGLKVTDWRELQETDEQIRSVRRGILIRKR